MYHRSLPTIPLSHTYFSSPSLLGQANHSEENLRKNIQRSLAVQLQNLSLTFRKSQKEYMRRLKSQKQGDSGDFAALLGADVETGLEEIENGGSGFTDAQAVMLEVVEVGPTTTVKCVV